MGFSLSRKSVLRANHASFLALDNHNLLNKPSVDLPGCLQTPQLRQTLVLRYLFNARISMNICLSAVHFGARNGDNLSPVLKVCYTLCTGGNFSC